MYTHTVHIHKHKEETQGHKSTSAHNLKMHIHNRGELARIHTHTYYKSNIAVKNGLRCTRKQSALRSLKPTIPADTCTDKTANSYSTHTIKEAHTHM